jgi:HK97 family phage portal protein
MAFLDTVAGWLGYTKATVANPPAWLTSEAIAEQFSVPERTLPTAQLELYQRLSWVQIAVGNVASAVATTPFNVGARTGEDINDVPNHPFELLLQRPNPLQSRAEFFESTANDYSLTGNSYWWLNKPNEKAAPAELWMLSPSKVVPLPDGRQFVRGYLYDAGGGENPILLEPWEVVHFKRYHPLNPFVGLSPIEALATVATADMSMQKYNANFFDKGFAKPQGGLAFADPIDDVSWQKIQRDVRTAHGGAKREMMMLRGAGKGGVEWLPMSLSQADMQFLDSRTFTKEEIFAIYAPGLSSILAVNATEANSIAGRKTFTEMAVWPHLVRMAEKITNDLLPLYGPNLVGSFEDIRITDRAMALQEQAAFGAVATVDEVRQKFYQIDPLGDDRGKLLLLEVGKGLTRTEKEAPPVQMIPGRQPGDNPAAVDEEKPPPDEKADEGDKQAEAKALRRWLKRRPKADIAQFENVHLSEAEVKAIATEIRGEGGADQGFLAQAGKATRKLPGEDGNDEKRTALEQYHADKIHAALRRLLRQVVPTGTTPANITPDEAVERYRAGQTTLRDALAEMLLDGAQLGADTGIAQAEWLMGIRKGGVKPDNERFTPTEKATITGTNWDLVNEAVLRWVLGSSDFGFGAGYADVITQALAATSERQIRRNVADWINNEQTLGTLIDNLERTLFSRKRAETVAITEITKSFAIGNELAWQESRVIGGKRWNTASDEIVCSICRPLNGVVAKLGEEWVHPETQQRYTMPAHPRDRCWSTPVLVEDMPQ